ncbi:Hypothetical predicted protein [Marmota monax]|uniref:Uncharacterized protein n=1 Tax=Marmota monax TaxID=9995 RepID=A0A5E4BD12_MARMO|nr:hypothetical protein GHT09_000954 [Marmota monax]VTJ67306.1 Hypothetical predicted protein [Marmota monax]
MRSLCPPRRPCPPCRYFCTEGYIHLGAASTQEEVHQGGCISLGGYVYPADHAPTEAYLPQGTVSTQWAASTQEAESIQKAVSSREPMSSQEGSPTLKAVPTQEAASSRSLSLPRRHVHALSRDPESTLSLLL